MFVLEIWGSPREGGRERGVFCGGGGLFFWGGWGGGGGVGCGGGGLGGGAVFVVGLVGVVFGCVLWWLVGAGLGSLLF